MAGIVVKGAPRDLASGPLHSDAISAARGAL
jgi:hypothetical protein